MAPSFVPLTAFLILSKLSAMSCTNSSLKLKLLISRSVVFAVAVSDLFISLVILFIAVAAIVTPGKRVFNILVKSAGSNCVIIYEYKYIII